MIDWLMPQMAWIPDTLVLVSFTLLGAVSLLLRHGTEALEAWLHAVREPDYRHASKCIKAGVSSPRDLAHGVSLWLQIERWVRIRVWIVTIAGPLWLLMLLLSCGTWLANRSSPEWVGAAYFAWTWVICFALFVVLASVMLAVIQRYGAPEGRVERGREPRKLAPGRTPDPAVRERQPAPVDANADE